MLQIFATKNISTWNFVAMDDGLWCWRRPDFLRFCEPDVYTEGGKQPARWSIQGWPLTVDRRFFFFLLGQKRHWFSLPMRRRTGGDWMNQSMNEGGRRKYMYVHTSDCTICRRRSDNVFAVRRNSFQYWVLLCSRYGTILWSTSQNGVILCSAGLYAPLFRRLGWTLAIRQYFVFQSSIKKITCENGTWK